jgi:hypothetical protein
MRLYSFVAAAALLSAALAAHADTFTQTFSASGATTPSHLYNLDTTAITSFSPTDGTLNSVTIALSGTATSGGPGDFDAFDYVALSSAPNTPLFSGNGEGPYGPGQSFSFSANGTDTAASVLTAFQVGASQQLVLAFGNNTHDISLVGGTLTYDYTPAASPLAPTPEPSSFALLGTGLLGALGIVRKRFAL